jgi:phage-related protein
MLIRHYATNSGREPVREFILELAEETRFEVLTLLRRMESGEILPMPHSRSMASMAKGLYELRVRDAQGQVRIFYYTKVKNVVYLVHALRKKSQTIPDKDRLLILKRIRELNEPN